MKDEEGDGSVSLMPSLKYAVQKKPDKKVGALCFHKVGLTCERAAVRGTTTRGREGRLKMRRSLKMRNTALAYCLYVWHRTRRCAR
jgi:hypothetical protein